MFKSVKVLLLILALPLTSCTAQQEKVIEPSDLTIEISDVKDAIIINKISYKFPFSLDKLIDQFGQYSRKETGDYSDNYYIWDDFGLTASHKTHSTNIDYITLQLNSDSESQLRFPTRTNYSGTIKINGNLFGDNFSTHMDVHWDNPFRAIFVRDTQSFTLGVRLTGKNSILTLQVGEKENTQE